MNTPNNKRKKESQEKIENVFLELIQNREINEISVTDICKNAELNRTTFYSNYLDIYDLAD
ncbi:MAG: TetR/AcrR family transcriptional regulator, partial [Clostridia bacterium]|nr:TetR/AcrR family transcriptional regulator [Clostridia bacterium]